MAVADIIASPATIWYAPVGETYPDETTVEYDDEWGGNWTNLGYTLEPVTVSMETETFDLTVQQLLVPVRTVRTSTTATIETTLAELTGTNLGLVTDGAVTTVAAAEAQVGFDTIDVDATKADVSLYAFGIQGIRVGDTGARLPVRIFIPRGSIILNGELSFAKDAGVGIPCQIKALASSSSTSCLVIHNITAPAVVAGP